VHQFVTAVQQERAMMVAVRNAPLQLKILGPDLTWDPFPNFKKSVADILAGVVSSQEEAERVPTDNSLGGPPGVPWVGRGTWRRTTRLAGDLRGPIARGIYGTERGDLSCPPPHTPLTRPPALRPCPAPPGACCALLQCKGLNGLHGRTPWQVLGEGRGPAFFMSGGLLQYLAALEAVAGLGAIIVLTAAARRWRSEDELLSGDVAFAAMTLDELVVVLVNSGRLRVKGEAQRRWGVVGRLGAW
jgi:hypothetical protein